MQNLGVFVDASEAVRIVEHIVGSAAFGAEFAMDDILAAGRFARGSSAQVSSHDFVFGLSRSIQHAGCGFLIDHADLVGLPAMANNVVERAVGVPDRSEWGDHYKSFSYNGDDITEGLIAFDEWLEHDHHWNIARYMYLDGMSYQRALSLTRNLRLVDVRRSDDMLLSVAHPSSEIDELIETLSKAGVQARRQALSNSSWPAP